MNLITAASIIADLVNPDYPPAAANVVEVKDASRQIGRQVLLLEARSAGEIDLAFAAMKQSQSAALLVGADPFFNSRRDQIVALAARELNSRDLRTTRIRRGRRPHELWHEDHAIVSATQIYAGTILKARSPPIFP